MRLCGQQVWILLHLLSNGREQDALASPDLDLGEDVDGTNEEHHGNNDETKGEVEAAVSHLSTDGLDGRLCGYVSWLGYKRKGTPAAHSKSV